MRLIDADALKENTRYLFRHVDSALSEMEAVRACTAAQIDDAPTIDAASVVRCSECRLRNTSWYDKRDMLESFCRWDRDESPNDDDYCSYGEKMESEGGT